jgi:DNA-binding SARP family transcriptional activator
MRYEILGPLRLLDEEDASSPSARQIEIILAALLIQAEQVVSAEQLMEEIWQDYPPRSAVASLYVHISQLRKFLHRPDAIVTHKPGYLLHVGADQFDLREFRLLTRQGRQHVKFGRHEEAADCFAEALRLWRGPALVGLRDGPIIGGFAAWMDEARLECQELHIESALALGQHRELVGHLYSLTVQHPLRETFHYQLMLALYRSGRQADALGVYQATRAVLQERLGLEPTRALRDLHQAILEADDRLDAGFRDARGLTARVVPSPAENVFQQRFSPTNGTVAA